MSVANTNNVIWPKEKTVIVNMVTSPQTSLLPVYTSGYWGRRGGGVLEQQDEGDDDIVLWVSLEQWGVQNGIASLIYLEQLRLDFPVFQVGLYCPWKWEKVNDLNNLLDYDINRLGDQDTQGHGRIIPSTLKCRLTWFLMFHDFQWRHPYPQAVLNLRCGERLSPPHPLFSVQPPPSRYSNVTRSSKSQVMFISICFINSATHIFPPLQEIIVSVAITRYSGCVPIDLENVLNWSGGTAFLH